MNKVKKEKENMHGLLKNQELKKVAVNIRNRLMGKLGCHRDKYPCGN